MKIVLVVPGFPKVSETFIVSKFLGLLEQGYDIHILCRELNREDWEQFPELKSRPSLKKRIHTNWRIKPRAYVPMLWAFVLLWTFLQQPRTTVEYLKTGWRRFGTGIFRRFYLDAKLVQNNPDIIHFEFGALAVDRMYLRDLLKCKIVVSFRGHDISFVGLDKVNYYRAIWEKADYLHLLGQDLWRRAQNRGCPSDIPHVLIPPAINVDLFDTEEHMRDGESLTILSVGRLEWAKGYEYALQAIRLVIDAGLDICYRIVGDGKYFEALTFCRYQLGLQQHVEFVGILSHEQVRYEMQKADIFLHAAVSEGFCNAVMEAQAMRLPVVTSNAEGLAENVDDTVTGFVVPRRDPEALASKLLLLAGDPELRSRMGEAGRKRVVEKFNISDQILKLAQLYDTVSEAHQIL